MELVAEDELGLQSQGCWNWIPSAVRFTAPFYYKVTICSHSSQSAVQPARIRRLPKVPVCLSTCIVSFCFTTCLPHKRLSPWLSSSSLLFFWQGKAILPSKVSVHRNSTAKLLTSVQQNQAFHAFFLLLHQNKRVRNWNQSINNKTRAARVYTTTHASLTDLDLWNRFFGPEITTRSPEQHLDLSFESFESYMTSNSTTISR